MARILKFSQQCEFEIEKNKVPAAIQLPNVWKVKEIPSFTVGAWRSRQRILHIDYDFHLLFREPISTAIRNKIQVAIDRESRCSERSINYPPPPY